MSSSMAEETKSERDRGEIVGHESWQANDVRQQQQFRLAEGNRPCRIRGSQDLTKVDWRLVLAVCSTCRVLPSI